jgi:rSAM/selenodomain-associated transferase 1
MSPILGVFAKVPRPGHVKTRLGEEIGMEKAAKFYAESLAWLLLRLSTENREFVLFFAPKSEYERLLTMYPLLESMDCQPQKGDDLGERMLNGIKYLYEEYESTPVLLGSDSPDLPFDRLDRAYEELNDSRTDLVLGPSRDGGYYLIGMNEPHEELFLGMEWSHSDVTEETLRRARQNDLTHTLLEPWRDYDRPEDVTAVLEESP